MARRGGSRQSWNGACAEAEDQVQLVLVAEREEAAEQRRDDGGEAEHESHVSNSIATRRAFLQVTCS